MEQHTLDHSVDSGLAHFTEARIAAIKAARPDLLTDAQRELAEAQHACREVNNRTNACIELMTKGMSAQCENCIAHRLAHGNSNKAA